VPVARPAGLVACAISTSAQRATNKPKRSMGAATATVEREQLIGHARLKKCDIHTLSWTSCRWIGATVFATKIR